MSVRSCSLSAEPDGRACAPATPGRRPTTTIAATRILDFDMAPPDERRRAAPIMALSAPASDSPNLGEGQARP